MNWTNTAILAAALMGAVNILDSHLLTKRFTGLREFLLAVAILHIIYAFIVYYLYPLPQDTGPLPILAAVASGLLRSMAVLIMLYNLKREQVSQVIPVVYTYPIFVAIIAVLLLGETLNFMGWIAIVIVVAGSVMVSVNRTPSGDSSIRINLLMKLFFASLLFAVADITSKYALNYLSPWNMYWLTSFCMTGIFFMVSARPNVVKNIITMNNRTSTLIITVINETLAPVGLALSLWALKRGPVSLVSTILGTRPMFVLLFAFILSRVAPSFLRLDSGKKFIVLRIIATAMIVGGLAMIYLI
jgi:drug/metabolite transporter (DMT)-like permease